MRIISTLGLSLAALAMQAQTGPQFESWILNQGEQGQYYTSGNFTPTSNGHDANVKAVYYTSADIYISSSGIPSYPIGPYQDGNPAQAGDKDYTFRIPRNPAEETGTKTSPGLGQTGVLINGVPVYNYSDAMSYNNQGIWNRNAVHFENDGFDCSKGHPAPDQQSSLDDGYYHHHQNPITYNTATSPASTVCDDYPSTGLYTPDQNSHSPLIGYAFDGYPIYGSFGYANTDGTGGIVRIESSYQLRNITDRTTLPDGTQLNSNQHGPAINSSYPLGAYQEDYEYVSGSGDLDEHNGRFCITPEYPGGTYAYFATIDADYNSAYPYFIGDTYYGVVATDNFPSGPSGGGTVTVPGSATEYTGTTTSLADFVAREMMVFPNPAQDHVTVYLQQDQKNVSISIIDMIGKTVVPSQTISHGTNWIDIQHLPTGLYIIRMEENGEVVTKKLIKQ